MYKESNEVIDKYLDTMSHRQVLGKVHNERCVPKFELFGRGEWLEEIKHLHIVKSMYNASIQTTRILNILTIILSNVSDKVV